MMIINGILNEAQVLEASELHRQGWSYRNLGSKFGVSYTTIMYYLRPESRARMKSYKRLHRVPDTRAYKVREENDFSSKRSNHKRPKPDYCELCQGGNRLCWHHWDDNDRRKGIWVCTVCHMFVEGVDKGRDVEKYLLLKNQYSTMQFP